MARKNKGNNNQRNGWSENEKDEPKSPGRRRFILALVGGGAAAAVGGAKLLWDSISSLGGYSFDHNNSRIYDGDYKNVIDIPHLAERIKQEWGGTFSKSIPGFYNVDVDELKYRTCIVPLKGDVDPRFERTLRVAKRDFARMNINESYTLFPLRGLEDILPSDDHVSPIYLAEKLGFEIKGDIFIRKKTLNDILGIPSHFEGFLDTDATSDFRCRVVDGHFLVDKKPIFVVGSRFDSLNSPLSVYSEMLHYLLRQSLPMIAKDLSNSGMPFDRAIFAFIYTEEAVAHAVAIGLVKQHEQELSMDPGWIKRELDQKSTDMKYAGLSILYKMVEKLGPERVLLDSYANPMNYWKLLEKNVYKFRDGLKHISSS